MKIGFYFSNIGSHFGGIYQYSLIVLKMLSHAKEIDCLYIFCSKDQKYVLHEYQSNPKVKMILHDESQLPFRFFIKFADFFLHRFYLKAKTPKVLMWLYKILQIERYYFNSFPLNALFVPKQYSHIYHLKYPVIVTMHDLQHIYFPEFFTPLERIYKSITYYTALCESNHIAVTFDHVKKDILKYYDLQEEKISKCMVDISTEWYYKEGYTSKEALVEKYELPEKFMLTPACTWPHKNHIKVLEAMTLLKNKGIIVNWVSTGRITPHYEEKIKPMIVELGLQKQVIFTGLISDEDLIGLYNISHLVIIPTLYEAGSGPLFEAMRYKIPVIAANTTTIPEHIGHPDFIIDPLSAQDIAQHIESGFFDENFRKENLKNSEERLQFYRSQDFTKDFIEMFKKLQSKP